MAIHVACEKCGYKNEFADSAAGKRACCARCKDPFVISAASGSGKTPFRAWLKRFASALLESPDIYHREKGPVSGQKASAVPDHRPVPTSLGDVLDVVRAPAPTPSPDLGASGSSAPGGSPATVWGVILFVVGCLFLVAGFIQQSEANESDSRRMKIDHSLFLIADRSATLAGVNGDHHYRESPRADRTSVYFSFGAGIFFIGLGAVCLVIGHSNPNTIRSIEPGGQRTNVSAARTQLVIGGQGASILHEAGLFPLPAFLIQPEKDSVSLANQIEAGEQRINVSAARTEPVGGEPVQPINFTCSGCARAYSVPPDKAGKRTKCPACGMTLAVPRPTHVQKVGISAPEAVKADMPIVNQTLQIHW